MSILVTGGCGFIGSHLVDALIKDGHDVVVLDDLSTGSREDMNPKARLLEGSVITPGIFDTFLKSVERCFHLASIVSGDRKNANWYAAHQVNSGGTVNLFDSIARSERKIPVVYASSSFVYGTSNRVPLAEAAGAEPVTPYAVDKLAAEKQASIAWNIHGIPNMGLRMFNVYGPRMKTNSPYTSILSYFNNNLSKGKSITIYGSGRESRDYIHVSDVILGLRTAMEKLTQKKAECDVMNICTGNAVTSLALAEMVGAMLGKKPDIEYKESRRVETRASVGDPSRAKSRLGFQARMALKEGIKKI